MEFTTLGTKADDGQFRCEHQSSEVLTDAQVKPQCSELLLRDFEIRQIDIENLVAIGPAAVCDERLRK